MKYKSYEVCSTEGCTELVEVTRHTREDLYCEKCTKKKSKKNKKETEPRVKRITT